MLINIASLNVRTGYPCVWDTIPPSPPYPPFEYPDRASEESIANYLARKYDEKTNTLKKYLSVALESEKRKGEYLFFSLPEFFWSISPYALWSDDDVNYASEYYLNNVTDIVKDVISEFPSDKFGKIVLLAGTAGALIEVENKPYKYDALNYLLCVNNFNIISSAGKISLWTKRGVALFDYGKGDQYNDRIYFQAGTVGHSLGMDVCPESKSLPEHTSNDDSFGPVFDNSIVPDIPFIISICADYGAGDGGRKDEWLNFLPKLHFLIACADTLSKTREYPDTVQYTVRNDGRQGDLPYPVAGGVEVFRVEKGFITGEGIEPVEKIDLPEPFEDRKINEALYLHEVEIS